MQSFTEHKVPMIYPEDDDVTFDVSVTTVGDDGDKYAPVDIKGAQAVVVAADNGEDVLVSLKGSCVPIGYDSPVGWLWSIAAMLARVRMAYCGEEVRSPTIEQIAALLCQAIEEYSPYEVTGFRKVRDGEGR